MIERTSDTGEVSIEEFSVPVIGLYETKLNQHTSSIFVTPNLLEKIQEFGQFDNTVFALDVLVYSQDDFTNVVDQIEKNWAQYGIRPKNPFKVLSIMSRHLFD